ncbi:putative signal transduction protein [Escherichia coli]|nr:putative signal transduction protein [Escherichia coli]SQR06804.1 putative signal transduction protein [Escherichia coli]
MRNTLIPILVAICLFITGVAILNIQLWYSAKAEYLAGARYAANNINHILEEASQATQTAVNIAGKWICPYISRHLLSLNPLLACCRRYSRGER